MRRVYVISDLHLGGRPDEGEADGNRRTGYQICHSYAALRDFVDWLREKKKESFEEETELVINGDIIDFLAEDDYAPGIVTQPWTIGQAHALHKFERAVDRTKGGGSRSFFDALRDFTIAGQHHLTLLLGNHDPELSLPELRQRFIELLGGNSPRLRFLYDGEAYSVGRVLIEHGNRYDRWNMIDHSGLRQERSVLSRHLPVDEKLRDTYFFIPPAGTHLVISFMNPLKGRYRFIDLLKPEDELNLPLLAALEPDYVPELNALFPKLRDALHIGLEYRKHRLATSTRPAHRGDLATDNVVDSQLWATFGGDMDELHSALPPGARLPAAGSGDMSIPAQASVSAVLTFLNETWKKVRARVATVTENSLIEAVRIHGAKLPEDRLLRLHQAFVRIQRDERAFLLEHEQAAYFNAARETASKGDFDVVVYGHTHLPKFVEGSHLGSSGKFTYINTGTWSNVMRLPFALTGDFGRDRAGIELFLNAMAHNDYTPFIKGYLSYAEIVIDPAAGGMVREAKLRSYCGVGKEREPPLTEHRLSTGER